MAPKSFIEVRSESWLNLTNEREREEVLIKELNKKFPKQVKSVSRHSLGSWQQLVNEAAKAGASQSSTLSSSNKNNKNEHLLIRLRQQSYLNRSSNSLSSNLSNSIDLTPSLIGNIPQRQPQEATVYDIPAELEDEQDLYSLKAGNRRNSDIIKLNDEQTKLIKIKNSILKEEPRRLKYLKNKLQNKGKLQRIDGNNKESNPESESPSLMRSLSSFSEKLNGKLGNFRHSWKHFLYSYNQQQQQQNHFEKQEEEEVNYNHNSEPMKNRLERDTTKLRSSKNIANRRFSECQEINKRQLTHDWLERYHKSTAGNNSTQRSEMRPKSLEIIQHIEEQLSLNKPFTNHRQEKEQQDLYLSVSRESSCKQGKNVFNENSGKSNSNNNNNTVATVNESKNNNYLTPDNQQLSNSSKLTTREFLSPNNNITQQRTSRDTSSSTTLVTALTTSNNNSFSASSSTTCLESFSSNLTLNSNSPFNQQDQQQDISTKSKPTLSAAEMNANNNNNSLSAFNLSTKQQIQDSGDLVFPTSDYWSTVASNDCYKQQQQQQPVGIENIQLINTQPMLVGDQEYYLDVANAAVSSNVPPFEPILIQPNQQLQPALLNDNHIPPFVNITPSIPTTTITMPQQIAPLNKQQINLQQQQQQQKQQQQQHLLNLPPAMDEDYDDYAVPADESCRLDRSQVELIQMIGEGQKGYVFLGKLQSKDGNLIQDVAIKTLKYETEELIDKLMREAAMMRQFEHPHIIKFIGVCPETPALIAMELAEFGEIKQYLKLNKQLIQNSQLILFTFQISTALSYLESKQYVHRDVAARNVLVCSHNCVKLADFGLSRNLSTSLPSSNQQQENNNNKWNLSHRLLADNSPDKSHYVAVSKGKLPVRWLAPESLAFRRFTSASDVWMFAVCSWELFHYGQVRPWAQIRNNQVLMAIESGQRLARPPNCPLRLYQLMLQCWSYAPIQRPKFRELKQSLWSIYLNEKAREQIELEQQQELKELEEKRHNQERLILLMNKQQQQQRLIEQEQQQQQQRILQQEVLGNQQNQFMMMRQHQQRINSMSPTSPITTTTTTGYATGNASGYSSTTATTADHSNNSSRSSSMGSLARSKAKLASARSNQQQQQQQQQRQTPAMLASSSGGNKNNLFQLKMTDINQHHQVAPPTVISPPLPLINEQPQPQQVYLVNNEAQRLSNSVKETKDKKMVGANMRRFQRMPGYVLQKQRSQGSIMTNDYNQSHLNDFVTQSNEQQISKNKQNHQQYQSGFDDCALLVSSARDRQIKRQLINELQIRIDNGNFNDDDDGDDDDDEDDDEDSSSETETTTAVNVRKLVNNMERMSLTSQMRTPEPAYEGLQQVLISRQEQQQQPQVVGSRPESCSATNWPLQEHNNRHQQRLLTPTPITRHYVQDQHQQQQQQQTSPGKRSRERSSEPKMNDILQSFKISPLKAKLTYNRQGSVVEARGNSRPGSELLVGQKDHRRNVADQAKVEEERQRQLQQQEQLQQQQQLELHQRLLGHIRPASSCKSRRSANLTNSNYHQSKSPTSEQQQQQQATKKVETVDQSLQILESLITMDDSKLAGLRKSATASPVSHNINNNNKSHITSTTTAKQNSKLEERNKNNSRYGKQCSMAATHAKLLGLATPNLHNYSPDT